MLTKSIDEALKSYHTSPFEIHALEEYRVKARDLFFFRWIFSSPLNYESRVATCRVIGKGSCWVCHYHFRQILTKLFFPFPLILWVAMDVYACECGLVFCSRGICFSVAFSVSLDSANCAFLHSNSRWLTGSYRRVKCITKRIDTSNKSGNPNIFGIWSIDD